jgi:hypothetical protein
MDVAQPLRWVGIATDLAVVCLDYANVVHRLSRDFGWQWVPVFDVKSVYDVETTGFWMVYAGDDAIYGVPLRGTRSPATYPLPACKQFALGPLTFERKLRPWLSLQSAPSLVRRIPPKQTDRELIKLFPDALKEEQELRAVELARMLRTKPFREFVVPFADRQGFPRVGDKLTGSAHVAAPAAPTQGQWRPLPGAEKLRRNLYRTTSEETVYVRQAADAPGRAGAENAAKPGGLLDVLEALGRSKAPFQADEPEEKERRKKEGRKKETEPPRAGKKRKKGKEEHFLPLFGS